MEICKKPSDFYFKITFSFIILILLVKLFFFFQYNFPGKFLLFLASFVQDSFLLMLNYSLFLLLSKVNSKYFQLFSKILFYILHIIFVFVSITYTKFISDLIAYPINIFRLDFSISSFFFEYFLSWFYIFLFIFLILAFFSLSFFLPAKINKRLYWIFIIILATLFIPTLFRPSINPVFYSVIEEIKILIHPSAYSGEIGKLNKLSSDYNGANFSFLDKRLNSNEKQDLKYKRIIVLVMESIDYNLFMKNSEDKNILWRDNKKVNCESYDNYFTTNLDSYPALFSMVYSFLFPYKAYSNDVNLSTIESNNNLVRFFNNQDFATYFIDTYNENPYLIGEKEWSHTLKRDDFNEEGFVCLNVNRIDSACEDKIAMKRMIEILKTEKKVFMFHEMVYGHLTLWEKETHIESIDYYNSFFNEFYEGLVSNNLSNDTLIVIVSDHGPRTNAMNIKNYHVPLLFCAEDLKQEVNNNFSSHLDFKNILFQKIGNSKLEYDRKVYVVGSSNQWVYGIVDEDGNYSFINNQNLNVVTNSNKEIVIELNDNFQKYLSYFQEKVIESY